MGGPGGTRPDVTACSLGLEASEPWRRSHTPARHEPGHSRLSRGDSNGSANAAARSSSAVGLSRATAERGSPHRRAAEYWADRGDPQWATTPTGAAARSSIARFEEIGTENLALFDRLAATSAGSESGSVLEWGVGGGANAVHFAPRAESSSLSTSTPTPRGGRTPAWPRPARRRCPSSSSTSPIPSRSASTYPRGRRPLRLPLRARARSEPRVRATPDALAAELLRPGALAFVQIKYSAGRTTVVRPGETTGTSTPR